MNCIYQIIDHNKIPIYIGKTNDITRRMQKHKNSTKPDNRYSKYYLYRKIRKLQRNHGYTIKYEILEQNIPDQDVSTREIYWIADLKKKGYKLCNLTDGGEGSLGHKPVFTKEWRENLSKAGKKRQRTNPSFKGRKHSTSSKKKMSIARKGKQVGKENPFYGKQHSEKFKQKLRKERTEVGLKHYKITSPEGKEYIVKEGLNSFCKRMSKTIGYIIRPCNFSAVLSGIQRHHKGWLIEYLT